MSRAIALSLVTLALPLGPAGQASAAEQTYKWRDERGGIHYGEKPPPGVRATLVDTQPNISQGIGKRERDCVGTSCATFEGDAQRLRREEVDRAVGRPASGSVYAAPRGLDFDVYIRLQSGMSEGELLLRAGPPDFEAVDNLRGPIGKSFYYYPTSANPYTTIVTLRGGRIFNIERVKRF